MTSSRAFTLIELMVVVGIMAFLGVASTGGYSALQRGMAERGATDVATKLLQAAKERALVDRQPTVVYFYNRLLREKTDEENAIVVGEAVAIRRVGRVTRVQGNFIIDEFADLCNSYDVLPGDDEGLFAERKGMKLWRMGSTQAGAKDMRYSVVADAVALLDVPGVTYQAWATAGDNTSAAGTGSKGQNIGQNTNDKDFNSTSENMDIRVYGFYNLNNSRFEPPSWSIGDGYGFEFASTQLPHDFIFGSGNVPSKVGDIGFVKAIYFDVGLTGSKGQNVSDESVDVWFCRPDAGGSPNPDHRAGTASSKEDTTL